MNHARVKALKGNGKTTSKKAIKSGRASGNITPRSSPLPSLLTSPTHSAVPSRVTSDVSDSEDDGDLEFDDMVSSIYSGGSGTATPEEGAKEFDAQALIDGLQDKKHNNNEIREQLLELYLKVIRNKYNAETHFWLDPAASALAEVFLRDADRGSTARERLLSLQAYCVTIGTCEDLDIFEGGERALKQILVDDDDDSCKVHAIYALCMSVLYAGGLEEAALEVMQYLVDIVQSDGESVDSHDNAAVVNAAIVGWTFVASHVEDFSDFADAAMDAFVDQLDSSDTDIQCNAGQAIALIFESSRDHEQETGEPFQLPYDPHRLIGRINELAKDSSKSVARKQRRDLRETLVSVVTSLERGVGPYYSTALYLPEKDDHVPPSRRTEDGQAEYGYRCKLRLGNHSTRIETWSFFSRVNMMKMLFRGGLQHHVFLNPVVGECLEDAHWGEEQLAAADHGAGRSSKGRKR
ncbi:IFRD domain-containing protein [Moelleriella libera RCEF 2490]|uniref:IFRD domain-containing protein n=1 Tax=Moelleriella libera RCEF 2490 TaxID=1081109 RepID=A0A168EQ19_9HYPO|nr:IFRD domain-containing protein [Moelleriella libera RCEF 2490]